MKNNEKALICLFFIVFDICGCNNKNSTTNSIADSLIDEGQDIFYQ